MRRHVLATRLLAILSLIVSFGSEQAFAQSKTIRFASYGGSFEQTIRQEVIPAFKKKTGIDVEYVAGNSTDTLAKLQAQKGNQQIDAIVVDDGPAYQAVDLGFCGELTPAPVFDDLYPVVKFPSKKAVGIGLVATGLMYNTKVFAENKWPAPTSWADLADPKYRRKLVVPPLNNTYGLHAVIAEAEINGGGVNDIDPGFKAFQTKIDPNVVAYEPSPAKMTELFQTGQAVLAVWGSGRVKALADTGFPVAFVYPKEGAIALAIAACPIAGSKNEAGAQAFVQFLLSPDMQRALAKGAGFGPVNKTVKLTPDEAKGIPYGDEAKSLKAIDWQVVNAHREEWNKRWVRQVER